MCEPASDIAVSFDGRSVGSANINLILIDDYQGHKTITRFITQI